MRADAYGSGLRVLRGDPIGDAVRGVAAREEQEAVLDELVDRWEAARDRAIYEATGYVPLERIFARPSGSRRAAGHRPLGRIG